MSILIYIYIYTAVDILQSSHPSPPSRLPHLSPNRHQVWQPSQPIFTLLMAAALGQEELSAKKLAGILFAFTGCVYMVLSGARSTDSHGAGNGAGASAAGGGERDGIGGGGGVGADTSDGPLHNDSYSHFPVWLPHVFFFFNCLGTPVYILASKRLMKTMPPLWVRTCVLTATHCPHSVSTIDA